MKQKNSAVRKGGKTDKEMSGKTSWRCDNCGEIHYSDEPPDECPFCLFPNKPFKRVDPEE
jgi:acyl-CoA dehydrogenase